MKITILTGNPGKILAAKSIFDKYKIETGYVNYDSPEIQADTSLEIARFTAIKASRDLNIPVIREDHSLFIDYLGIPGPYTNFIEKKLPATKLLKILKNQTNRNGYFEVAAVYAEPNGNTKEFIFQVPIKIAKSQRGNLQEGWNRIIKFENETRTFAEYPESERLDVWNQNYNNIAKWLLKENL